MDLKTRIISTVMAALWTTGLYAQPIGQWDFNAGTLAGTVGGPLDYADGAGGATEQATQFGTTTALGIPDIGGAVANVVRVPKGTDATMGFNMPVAAPAGNGGGELLNSYTFILDILFPSESHSKWRALLEADYRQLDADAEFFVNPSNGIGISGEYQGSVQSNTWYRIGLVMDAEAQLMRKYIDGNLVGSQSLPAVDGRFALAPGGLALLFSDNDGETEVAYVNSIQLRDVALSTADMAALGGATAAGIPQTIGSRPSFVESQVPAPGAIGATPLPVISAVVNPGDQTVTAGSIRLSLDGIDTPATAVQDGSVFRISHTVTNAFTPLSQHTVSVRYTDNSGAKTNTWSFTVADYKSLTLPTPIALETFDGVAEGTYPTGWVATNNTTSLNPDIDLNVASSDAYLDFAIISSNTLRTVHGDRRLNIQPYIVNGQLVPSLAVGNLAYAESDTRGGSQVQVLFSPDYNIAGRSNIYLSFYSIYEQNQDDIAGVEYSVDGGQTWQPLLYMLDDPDIIKDGEGVIDGYATLSTPRTDQAHGEAYGAFIGVESNRWAQLAPFIQARVNDDPVESKRVELLRLPEADGKQTVRLRFFQAGTGSWYFGVDNVGIYSVEQALPPVITRPPTSQVVSAGTEVTLRVEATGSGLTYQWQFGGTNIAGATEPTLTLRNFQAANAGNYTVVVGNSGGQVTSSPAVLEIFSGPITEGLVAHLKFDGNLNDSSGRNNNGQPIGGPTFQSGRIGSAVHIPSGADYVTLGTPADLNFSTDTDFSISFWAQVLEMTGDPSFVGNKDWNSGGNQGYVLATDDDRHFQWNLAGPAGSRKDYDGPAGVLTTNWHHIVVTYDRQGNATTYIDGTVVDARSLTANQNNVNTPEGLATNIGQDGTGNYGSSFSDANFDDLGIWRRVLTPQEVAAIHTAGVAGLDLSTVTVGGGGGGDVQITAIQRSGNNLAITVSGTGTIQLQKKTLLSDASWTAVSGTPVNGVFTVPIEGATGFFRAVRP